MRRRKHVVHNNAERYERIVQRGPAEAPEEEEMQVALASMLPEDEQRQLAQDPGTAQPQSIRGALLFPLHLGLRALWWTGNVVNSNVTLPIAQTVVSSVTPLGGSLLGWLGDLTPERARHLARIIGNATYNLIGLTQTKSGIRATASGGKALTSGARLMGSPKGRELITDAASSLIRTFEAMDTPEVHAAIRSAFGTAERGIALLSTPEATTFLDDAADFLSRSLEMLSAAETTDMIAEAVANLCAALKDEYDRSADQGADQGRLAGGASASPASPARAEAAPVADGPGAKDAPAAARGADAKEPAASEDRSPRQAFVDEDSRKLSLHDAVETSSSAMLRSSTATPSQRGAERSAAGAVGGFAGEGGAAGGKDPRSAAEAQIKDLRGKLEEMRTQMSVGEGGIARAEAEDKDGPAQGKGPGSEAGSAVERFRRHLEEIKRRRDAAVGKLPVTPVRLERADSDGGDGISAQAPPALEDSVKDFSALGAVAGLGAILWTVLGAYGFRALLAAHA